MLKTILDYGNYAYQALDSQVPLENIIKMKSKDMLAKARFEKDFDGALKNTVNEMKKEFKAMGLEAM